MTTSFTQTWNRTHARKVAGKVVADLLQMQQAYGKPSTASINDYLNELETLLADGYLDTVTYGFRRGSDWVVALKYKATELGLQYADDYSGKTPRGKDVSGATWYSFLEKSNAFYQDLNEAQRAAYEAKLPFKRTPGVEPSAGGNAWHQDKSYQSGGGGVRRSVLGAS